MLYPLRAFSELWLAGVFIGCLVKAESAGHDTRSTGTDTYDYIIVGGGVSGLVVANRLTEDRRSE